MIERIYKDNDRYYWIDDDEIDKLRKSGTSAEGNIRCQCPVCGDHSKNWSMSYNIRLGKGRCFHTAHHIFINIRMKHGLQHVASPEGAPLKFVDVDKLKLTPIVDEFLKYMLDNRGISYGTAVALGWKQCYRTRNGCTSAWLATPYYNAGKIVNVQYRNMKDKAFEFEKGAVPGLQNVDAVLGTEEMFIVEGSMDLATLFEAGHQNTVSLGNGADTNMENFDYFRKTHFDDKRKIFIAGDMDGPGMKARERQLKYFGYGKCHMVYWQYEDEEKGISISANDANGLWMSAKEKGLDPKAVIDSCIGNAKPCDIPRLSRQSENSDYVLDILHNGHETGKTIDLTSFDEHVRFLCGYLYLITGIPGCGKSAFVHYLLTRLAINYGMKSVLFSPETFPEGEISIKEAQIILGHHLDRNSSVFMNDNAVKETLGFLDRHICFVNDGEDNSIDNLLAIMEAAVDRYGIEICVIDPFNYISLSKDTGMTETQKISEVLNRIVRFARRKKVLFIIVPHPKKPSEIGGKKTEPNLYDVYGSSDFNNKCDVGIILVRDYDTGVVTAHVLKVKNEQLGSVGKVELMFDSDNGRYYAHKEITASDGINKIHIALGKSNKAMSLVKEPELPFISGEQPETNHQQPDGDNQQPDADHPFGEEINNVPF